MVGGDEFAAETVDLAATDGLERVPVRRELTAGSDANDRVRRAVVVEDDLIERKAETVAFAPAVAEARGAVLAADGDTEAATHPLWRAITGYTTAGQRLNEARARGLLRETSRA